MCESEQHHIILCTFLLFLYKYSYNAEVYEETAWYPHEKREYHHTTNDVLTHENN